MPSPVKHIPKCTLPDTTRPPNPWLLNALSQRLRGHYIIMHCHMHQLQRLQGPVSWSSSSSLCPPFKTHDKDNLNDGTRHHHGDHNDPVDDQRSLQQCKNKPESTTTPDPFLTSALGGETRQLISPSALTPQCLAAQDRVMTFLDEVLQTPQDGCQPTDTRCAKSPVQPRHGAVLAFKDSDESGLWYWVDLGPQQLPPHGRHDGPSRCRQIPA